MTNILLIYPARRCMLIDLPSAFCNELCRYTL